MSKARNLSERIAERVIKQSSRQKNRAEFLAVKEEVRQALLDGWPITQIWQTLRDEGKISCKYDPFRGSVNRLILSEPPQAIEAVATPITATDKPVTSSKPAIEPVLGFTFNSIAKKEELF